MEEWFECTKKAFEVVMFLFLCSAYNSTWNLREPHRRTKLPKMQHEWAQATNFLRRTRTFAMWLCSPHTHTPFFFALSLFLLVLTSTGIKIFALDFSRVLVPVNKEKQTYFYSFVRQTPIWLQNSPSNTYGDSQNEYLDQISSETVPKAEISSKVLDAKEYRKATKWNYLNITLHI